MPADFSLASENGLIVTEIMYEPSENSDGEKVEWIEMYAKNDVVLTLKSNFQIDGFYLCAKWDAAAGTCKTGYSYVVYSPDGIAEIKKGDFVIFTKDPAILEKNHEMPSGTIILKTSSLFDLLYTSDGFVAYSQDNKASWKDLIKYSDFFNEQKIGYSLERIDFDSENTDGNWQESYVKGGTPGKTSSEKPAPKEYSKNIRLNELFPNPEESPEGDYEFAEIYSFDDETIDLDGWTLKDKTKTFNLDGEIKAGGYRVFYDAVSLNNDGDEIGLWNPNGEEVSKITYEDTEEGKSLSFGGKEWKWSTYLTPGEDNQFDEVKEYPDEIYLNEILPHPTEDEENEFIEIYNPTEEDADIGGWLFKDSSKSGKYAIPKDTTIKKESYLVFYRKEFSFALNNSGSETVYFFDPNDKEISKVDYSGSHEGVSYNFDGDGWRWSKFLTPGKENRFNNLPKIEIKKDKEIFKNVPANFSVKINDPDKDEVKVTWDFGDGHKSYKKKTTHKYEKNGNYDALVKIFDGSEEMVEKLKIKVEKFSKKKVEIIALVPNPKGKDSDGNEWVEIKNNSKKKVNLKNWIIATGGKKLINHVIKEDISIKPGKTAKITKEEASFSLNNKKGKVELRYPDKKTASKVSYSKDKIGDDEEYRKQDKKWQWISRVIENNNSNVTQKKAIAVLESFSEVFDENNPSESGSISNGQEKTEEVLGIKTEEQNNFLIKKVKESFLNKNFFYDADLAFARQAKLQINGNNEYLFNGVQRYEMKNSGGWREILFFRMNHLSNYLLNLI